MKNIGGVLLTGCLAMIGLAGCGGSDKPTPPPTQQITVSMSGQPSTLAANATAALTATVTNDSANAGVKWAVSCGSSGACGSFSPATTPSGTATTYTAPAAVPSGNTVTVTATSVTDSTKTAAPATITITQPTPPPPTLSDGTYVYHLSGQNTNGQCFFAGSFTVANGAITGGEQDFSDSVAAYGNAITASGSSLSAASSGNLQVVLATTNTNIGTNGVITLRGTKVSNARILISEYDGYATGSGSMDLQTSTAAPSGGYAFVINGIDIASDQSQTPLSIGGILNVSGTSVSASGSVFDYNLGGSPNLNLTFGSGTVSAPDQYGRVSFNLTPSDASGVPGFILTGYIVGTNQIQLIESQQDDLSDNLAGMALGQGSNTGTFNAGSIAGKNYTFGTTGIDVNYSATFAGVFNFSSSLGLSGPLGINDLTSYGEDPITGGSATVDATGRVTISNVTTQNDPLNGNFGFQMYLDGNGNAMVMGMDEVEVSGGQAYLRTGTPPRAAGAYSINNGGFLNDQNGTPWSSAGAVTVNSGSYTGFTDYNDGGTPSENQSLSGSLNTTTDVIALTGLDAVAFTTANDFLDYPIDNNRIVMLSIDQNLLDLMMMETVTK